MHVESGDYFTRAQPLTEFGFHAGLHRVLVMPNERGRGAVHLKTAVAAAAALYPVRNDYLVAEFSSHAGAPTPGLAVKYDSATDPVPR